MYLDVPIVSVREERCWREIIRNVYWADCRIEEVNRVGQDVLRIKYAGEVVPTVTVEAIQSVSAEIVRSHQRVPVRVIFSNGDCNDRGGQNSVQQLVDTGSIRLSECGSLEASGLFLRVMRGLDEEFSIYAESLGTEIYEFPSLIPIEVAKQCGIFNNQPQHIHFVNNLQYHIDGIKQFKSAIEKGETDIEWADNLASPEKILSPAVCYHYWSRIRGAWSSAIGVRVGTALGRCYRFEVPRLIGLERLCEFKMREIFGVGLPEDVNDLRHRFLDYIKELMLRLELTGRIETAFDSFFVDNYSKKRMFQLNLQLKHEMLLWLPYKREMIAVASVNDHRDFFTKAFDINSEDSVELHSCCMAFGLERFALAVLAQHGLDPANWPSALTTLVGI